MSLAYGLTLGGLLVVLALAAYVDRVYSEMGKFLAREYQDNIDAWTRAVEPRLRLGRESIALSASVLRQLALAAIALIAGLRLYVHCGKCVAGARAERGGDCVYGIPAGAADPVFRPADCRSCCSRERGDCGSRTYGYCWRRCFISFCR